jgi:transposase-like protein
MKTILEQEVDIYPETGDRKLATVYPQLYCPRCGSYEIGLRRFQGDEAIWGCRDCAVLFTLNFPDHSRF